MSYPKKPIPPVARQQMKPLTPEEEKEQNIRLYVQKKASLAEGILFNLVQGCLYDDSSFMMDNCKKIVKMANDMADEFMKVVYHTEIKIQEDSEE